VVPVCFRDMWGKYQCNGTSFDTDLDKAKNGERVQSKDYSRAQTSKNAITSEQKPKSTRQPAIPHTNQQESS